jgi:hypothetical protein
MTPSYSLFWPRSVRSAASCIEARRKEHHAKRFATLYLRDIAAAQRPRNLIRASRANLRSAKVPLQAIENTGVF